MALRNDSLLFIYLPHKADCLNEVVRSKIRTDSRTTDVVKGRGVALSHAPQHVVQKARVSHVELQFYDKKHVSVIND